MDSDIQCSDVPEFMEVDPTGRYGRYNEILGKGASKIVYRGFDEYEGVEIAWNQVKLNDFLQCPEDLERLYCEIHLLKTLKHKNIMKFKSSWVDTSKRKINFVTEMFTSGTLRQYREKHRSVNIRAVKHWCRQILSGLLYLHSHVPPIIHRDLKCDNIFVNGNQGQVKIGDMGLAAILRKPQADHCVGTPEFMAPEVYEEAYNELVDIYSFGMCVLEMVTLEYPYSECTHPAQIYKKVISGRKPDALYKVKDPEIRRFMESCIVTVSERPSARELLNDPFLQIEEPGMAHWEIDVRQPVCGSFQSDGSSSTSRLAPDDLLTQDMVLENGSDWNAVEFEMNRLDTMQSPGDDTHDDLEITIKGVRKEDGSIFLRFRTCDSEGHVRNIYFLFDIENDTALGVASEMIAELNITDHDVGQIAEMIDGEVSSLIPEWQPKEPEVVLTSSIINYMSISNDSSDENLECHGRFGEVKWHATRSDDGVTGVPDLSPSSDIAALSRSESLESLDLRELKAQKNLPLEARKSFHYRTNFSYQIPSNDFHGDTNMTNGSKKFAENGNHTSEEFGSVFPVLHNPRLFAVARPYQWLL